MEQTTSAQDFPVQATLKVRGSVWRNMKIEAIRRGITLAQLAEIAFVGVLNDEKRTSKTRDR